MTPLEQKKIILQQQQHVRSGDLHDILEVFLRESVAATFVMNLSRGIYGYLNACIYIIQITSRSKKFFVTPLLPRRFTYPATTRKKGKMYTNHIRPRASCGQIVST